MSSLSPEKLAALATVVRAWWNTEPEQHRAYGIEPLAKRFGTSGRSMGEVLRHLGWTQTRSFARGKSARIWEPPAVTGSEKTDAMKQLLRRGAYTIEDLSTRLSITRGAVVDICDNLRGQGYNVHEFGGHIEISKAPGPSVSTEAHIIASDKNGYTKFGFTTDNHLCSKYAREDILADLYDWFHDAGCSTVFNAGNWIDGEARFNKHDIFVHGMEQQVDYFVEKYPSRKGVTTKFVSGDDHEGWYGQREGIDIGAFAESKARAAGRKDLVHLGFVESFITLENKANDTASQILLVHPGGGSAYATSYAPQKYVEALQGGEKPACVLFGHWHKIFDLLIRNVVCLGGGCTKDLDPFGRKLKLAYHLGGMIVELWQDEKGAIQRWRVEKKQYFDRGYYNDQWRYAGRPSRRAV